MAPAPRRDGTGIWIPGLATRRGRSKRCSSSPFGVRSQWAATGGGARPGMRRGSPVPSAPGMERHACGRRRDGTSGGCGGRGFSSGTSRFRSRSSSSARRRICRSSARRPHATFEVVSDHRGAGADGRHRPPRRRGAQPVRARSAWSSPAATRCRSLPRGSATRGSASSPGSHRRRTVSAATCSATEQCSPPEGPCLER